MPKDISIKELRATLSDIADRVEQGESYRVIRRSKPLFYIVSMNVDLSEEEWWETVVDFTDGGKTTGMPVKDAVKLMKKIRRSS